jgi:glc operon protein GlcG
MKTKPCLTDHDVEKMMAACRAEAAKHKWIVAISITDDSGFLLRLERMEGAGPMTAEVSHLKAKTAALSRRPTKFWEDRLKDRVAFLKFPENLPIQGGIPLMYQGECVGAIGVSGVQSHEDEQVANVGAAVLS